MATREVKPVKEALEALTERIELTDLIHLIADLTDFGFETRLEGNLLSVSAAAGRAEATPRAIPTELRPLANTILNVGFQSPEFRRLTVESVGPAEVFPLPTEGEERAAIERDITQYHVEPVMIGTVCWAHYYHGDWRLSTKRRVDARGVQMRHVSLYFGVMNPITKAIRSGEMNTELSYAFLYYHDLFHLAYNPYARVEAHHNTTSRVGLWHIGNYNRLGEKVRLDVPLAVPLSDWVTGVVGRPSLSEAEELTAVGASGYELGYILRHENSRMDYIYKTDRYRYMEKYASSRGDVYSIAKSVPEEQRTLFLDCFPCMKRCIEGVIAEREGAREK